MQSTYVVSEAAHVVNVSRFHQGYNSLRNRDWQRTGSHVYTSVIFNNNNNLFFERALDASCTAARCCAARK